MKADRRPAPTVGKVGREYDPYHWLIQHLSAAQDWPRIFEIVEDRSFLVNQATYFDSFRHSSQSLEGLILPALVRLEDWPRFLRYTLVAIHLRGLAESLVEEEIVRRLVESGCAWI